MTDIWQAALRDLQTKVSEHNYRSWFRDIRLHHQDGFTAYLEVADEFFKAWIQDNYLDLLEDSLQAVTGTKIEVVIDIKGAFDEDGAHSMTLEDDKPVAARMARVPRQSTEEVQGGLFTALDEESSELLWEEPLAPAIDIHDSIVAAGMNPRYTFDEYVVGPSNQFTHAASLAVASNPGKSYNPLFIFGGVGLGKTHLLQAVGIDVLRENPGARIVNLSAEEFMNEMITSLRHKEMNAFRTQFRNNCDVLLIDDIQFIGGKDSTQEEFFHTFNALYHSGKQIVITSDKSPKELPGIEERLASRFSWGLIADIQPPEMETRLAILEKKAEADGLALGKDVAMLLASSIRSNVRELEGTLIRLGAQASLMGSALTLEFTRQMLKRMNIEQGRQISTDKIIRLVANRFDLKPADLKGSRRTRNISEPRQVAMYLARKHTNDSFPEIGRQFGGKDHTTVMAAFRKLEDLIKCEDAHFTGIVDELEAIMLR